MKNDLRFKATSLRKQGWTYSEILQKVPVARSTLSLWLRSVSLSKKQKLRISNKKVISALKGASLRKLQRIQKEKDIKKLAQKQIDALTSQEFWLMGIMLYWAEGAKTKEHNPSQRVVFSNSDPLIISFFIRWLKEAINIPDDKITFEIYLHINRKQEQDLVRRYWADRTGHSIDRFVKIYYKKNKPKTKRKNIGNTYHGLLRVVVKESTDLNRKISGWIEGVCEQCGVV